MPRFGITIGERTASSDNVHRLLTPLDYHNLSFSTKVNGGFDSCRFLYRANPQLLNFAYENWHARKIRIYDQRKQLAWEGMVWDTRKLGQAAMEVSCVGYWASLGFQYYVAPGSLGVTNNDVAEDTEEELWSTADHLAQGIQVSADSTVVECWLKLRKDPFQGSGWMDVAIHTNTAGAPSGTFVANGLSNRVSVDILTEEFRFIKFSFPGNVSLTATTQYWLVLQITPESSLDNTNGEIIAWALDSTATTYTGGNSAFSTDGMASWTNGSRAATNTTQDFVFTVVATINILDIHANVLSQNGGLLNASTARIQNQNITTVLEPSGTRTGLEMIEEMLGFGDDQTIPRIWYAAVYDDRLLSIFPRPTVVNYVVRGSDPDAVRSLGSVYNRVRVKYQVAGANNETSFVSDSNPFSEFTKELELDIGEANSTRADSVRTAALDAFRQTAQRGSATIETNDDVRLFAGAPWPKHMMRAGQVVRLGDSRPVFTGAVGGLDNRSTFVITATRYDANRDQMELSFDFEDPSLQALLLQTQRQQAFTRWQQGILT